MSPGGKNPTWVRITALNATGWGTGARMKEEGGIKKKKSAWYNKRMTLCLIQTIGSHKYFRLLSFLFLKQCSLRNEYQRRETSSTLKNARMRRFLRNALT